MPSPELKAEQGRAWNCICGDGHFRDLRWGGGKQRLATATRCEGWGSGRSDKRYAEGTVQKSAAECGATRADVRCAGAQRGLLGTKMVTRMKEYCKERVKGLGAASNIGGV